MPRPIAWTPDTMIPLALADCIPATPTRQHSLLLTGSAGYGKTVALTILLWRWLAQGGHAWVLADPNRCYRRLTEIATAHGIPTWTSARPDGNVTDARLVLRETQVHPTHTHDWDSSVGMRAIRDQIADRMTLPDATTLPPVVVAFDTEDPGWLNVDVLADMLGRWSAWNLHPWMVRQTICGETPAHRALWAGVYGRLRFHYGGPPAPERYVVESQLRCGELICEADADRDVRHTCVVAAADEAAWFLRPPSHPYS